MLGLYGAALLICGACRMLLKLRYMDSYTGFYEGGYLYVAVFNVLLAAVPVIMFVTNRLKKPDDDYPVDAKNRLLDGLMLLTAISVIAFAIVGPPASNLEQGHSAAFDQMRDYANMGLGLLSGLAFVYLGIGGVFGRKKTPLAGVVAIPAVWQMISLITRYNAYTTVTAISDHMLAVMFMVFHSLFLVGMARTVCSQMRRDGRNYAIPSGLCASLCGFLLVIPNYVYMAVYSSPMPVRLLGLFESACILMMSVFALVFVVALMKSIKRV